jgi:hypothetical protein
MLRMLSCAGVYLLIRFCPLQAQSEAVDSTAGMFAAATEDTIPITTDSIRPAADSALTDSTAVFSVSPNAIEDIITYFAKDSITFDLKANRAYLHDSCNLQYEDADLHAHYVEINFTDKELFAKGTADTSGNLQGTPVFRQDAYEIRSEELKYNFNSKKGLIYNVITQEGESYLHGKIVKKNTDNTSFIRHGKYTTCNLPHPHFEIDFGKAKVIPNDKIVSGPLYLRVANIPIPLGLPFGIFPNTNKQKNGFIPPVDYGVDEYSQMGLYIKGIGYYFAIRDRIDFMLTATLYTRGGFGVNWKSNYVKRYRFNGNFELEYLFKPVGERETKQFSLSHEFKVVFLHSQDVKAHPRNRFSANINFRTSNEPVTAMENYESLVSNSTASSISFRTSWGRLFNLGINADIRQEFHDIRDTALRNERNKLYMNLPNINFNISQFYPLRRKKPAGKLRWYENISMQYTLEVKNSLYYAYDTALFASLSNRPPDLALGISHYIPVKSTIKILKHLSWDNSVSLTETWTFKGEYRNWGGRDTLGRSVIERDTVWGFWAGHNLGITSSLSTTLYGMWSMKKGRVQAFRHTFSPSVSFTYRPGINSGIYRTYFDSVYDESVRYSPVEAFSGRTFGAPSENTSASINFSINNRLEAKVKPGKEGDPYRKITILESLSLSTGYDFAMDSLRWKPLSVSARTLILKYINVSVNLSFDPYCIMRIDSLRAVRVNRLEVKENRRLFRFSSMGWQISCGVNLNRDFFKRKDKTAPAEEKKRESVSGFGQWNVNISYVLSHSMNDNYAYYFYRGMRSDTVFLLYNKNISTSVTVDGQIALTPKWKFGFRTGYDFITKTLSFSEFSIDRDLHCWKMGVRWRPFGYRGFEFNIAAKASILQDIKYNRKKSYQD